MNLLAIDPGLNGAYAWFRDGDLITADDLPTIGEASQRRINGAAWNDIIELTNAGIAIIEDVSAFPGQGVSSMFRFGRAVGCIEGVLLGAGVRLHRVTPRKWQEKFGLVGKTKGSGEPSRQRAIEMFPAQAQYFARKKDHNRAEAALIGLWFTESADKQREAA